MPLEHLHSNHLSIIFSYCSEADVRAVGLSSPAFSKAVPDPFDISQYVKECVRSADLRRLNDLADRGAGVTRVFSSNFRTSLITVLGHTTTSYNEQQLMALISYCKKLRVKLHPSLAIHAVRIMSMVTLNTLLELGCPLNQDVFAEGVKVKSLCILSCLKKNRCPRDSYQVRYLCGGDTKLEEMIGDL